MNNLTNGEKKALYVLIGVFVLCVLEYTFFTFSSISSTIESFITILLLGALSIYVFTEPRAVPHTKSRLIGYYFVWMFVCAVIYLVIFFGCGFLFGFGRNPYRRDALGIMQNIVIFGGIIVLKEWIRNFVINKVEKKHTFIFGLIIVLLYTFIEVNVFRIFESVSLEEFTITFTKVILPVLALNIFITYASYTAGVWPSVMYMLVVSVPLWLFDSLPNLEWIVIGIIGLAFPMVALVSLMETVSSAPGSRKRKTITEPKTKNVILWVLVGAFCINVAFFTAGLFKTYPMVLVSGSMSPTINRGDVAIIKRVENDDEIEIDDVILFNTGRYDVVHRVIDIYYVDGAIKYKTQGDANSLPDNLDIEIRNIGGVVIAKVPYLGLPRLMFEEAEFEDEINIG